MAVHANRIISVSPYFGPWSMVQSTVQSMSPQSRFCTIPVMCLCVLAHAYVCVCVCVHELIAVCVCVCMSDVFVFYQIKHLVCAKFSNRLALLSIIKSITILQCVDLTSKA